MELSRLMIPVTESLSRDEASAQLKKIEPTLKNIVRKGYQIYKKYYYAGSSVNKAPRESKFDDRLTQQMYAELEPLRKEVRKLGCTGVGFETGSNEDLFNLSFGLRDDRDDHHYYVMDIKNLTIKEERW